MAKSPFVSIRVSFRKRGKKRGGGTTKGKDRMLRALLMQHSKGLLLELLAEEILADVVAQMAEAILFTGHTGHTGTNGQDIGKSRT